MTSVATVAERPDLVEPAAELTREAFREYNHHGDVLERYWPRLLDEPPEYQFHLLGEDEEILAAARSLPVRWSGSLDDLPAGIDGALARGLDEPAANVLCVLLIVIPRALQGRGASRPALEATRELAGRNGLEAVIAPVRPSWKERYPLVPIERYAARRRADGLLFDPWLRVHERLGAAVLRPESRSLRISGAVADWEAWTAMSFPESGDYWFPGGLATVAIDRQRDRGAYWEPNVWMRHDT